MKRPNSPLSDEELEALLKTQEEMPAQTETIISEMQKMSLEAGDDLVVKVRGDDFDHATLNSLKAMLEERYPDNRVMIFYLPPGAEIDFSVIKKI